MSRKNINSSDPKIRAQAVKTQLDVYKNYMESKRPSIKDPSLMNNLKDVTKDLDKLKKLTGNKELTDTQKTEMNKTKALISEMLRKAIKMQKMFIILSSLKIQG